MEFEKFLAWERKTKDTIDFKRIYLDMAGDLVAGLMLSQIVYWHLLDKDGKTRLRVHKAGYYWMAKAHKDWYAEARISEYKAPLALSKLKERGLVVVDKFKFNGAPTTHIRINKPIFLKSLESQLKKRERESKPANHPNGNEENCDFQPAQTGDSLTENTTENPSKIKKELSADSATSFSIDRDLSQTKKDDGMVELTIPSDGKRTFEGFKRKITSKDKETAVGILRYLDRDPECLKLWDDCEIYELIERLRNLLGIQDYSLIDEMVIGYARVMLTFSEERLNIDK